MRRKYNGSDWSMFLTAALFLAALIIYSVGTGGNSDFISSICDVITSPIQRVSALVSSGFGSMSGEFRDVDEIRAENELLKKKVREMTRKTVDYNTLKEENESYRKLLELKQENEEYRFLSATVISRDTGDYYGGFTVDQGSADGVELHDPVVTADGLVGYVSSLGLKSAKVTTILSPGLEIGAADKETRDGGTLFGEITSAKSGRTRLNYLARDCEVTVGDIVVTSGFGSVFPANLVIGEVAQLRAESENISFYAEIVPAADVKNCTSVFVITQFEGQHSVEDHSIDGYKTGASDSE